MKYLLHLCEKLNNHVAILRKLGKVDKESKKKKGREPHEQKNSCNGKAGKERRTNCLAKASDT